MKVIDTYSDDIGYLVFVLEDGSEKRLPAYWALSSWTGASDHKELQSLMAQAIKKEYQCPVCKGEYTFLSLKKNIEMCFKCEAIDQLDLEIMRDLNLI